MALMETYIAIFTKAGMSLESMELDESFKLQSNFLYESTVEVSKAHSCHIFAIEGQFDLNLITRLYSVLDNIHSVGIIDEDELSWMSFGLAA